MITAWTLDGKEAFRVEAWDSTFRLAGWLDDGSLLAFQPFEIPSRVERYDPRTGKRSLHRVVSPLDPAGVPVNIRARATPDGRTIAFQFRRMNSVLTTVDWGGHPP